MYLGMCTLFSLSKIFFIFLKILFIFRERGREGEREGEKHRCLRYIDRMHVPNRGPGLQLGLQPGLQPRLMPRLGIEPETFWFAGRHLIY